MLSDRLIDLSSAGPAGILAFDVPGTQIRVGVDRIHPTRVCWARMGGELEDAPGWLTNGEKVIEHLPEWAGRFACASERSRTQPLARLEAADALLDSGIDRLQNEATRLVAESQPYLGAVLKTAWLDGHEGVVDLSRLAQIAERVLGGDVSTSVAACASLGAVPDTVPDAWSETGQWSPGQALSAAAFEPALATYRLDDGQLSASDIPLIVTAPRRWYSVDAERDGAVVIIRVESHAWVDEITPELTARATSRGQLLDAQPVWFPQPDQPGYIHLLVDDADNVEVEVTINPGLPPMTQDRARIRAATVQAAALVDAERYIGPVDENEWIDAASAWRAAGFFDYAAEIEAEGFRSSIQFAGEMTASRAVAAALADNRDAIVEMESWLLAEIAESSDVIAVVGAALIQRDGVHALTASGRRLFLRALEAEDDGQDSIGDIAPDVGRSLMADTRPDVSRDASNPLSPRDALTDVHVAPAQTVEAAADAWDTLSLLDRLTACVPHFIRACTPSILPDHLPDQLDLERSDTSVSFAGLGSPLSTSGPFGRANELVRSTYGARRAWSFTNGSTGANWVIARTIAERFSGRTVLVSRGAHISVPQALDDFGVEWTYIPGRYDPRFEAVLPTEPDDVAAALRGHDEVAAVWLVGPTYEGAWLDTSAVRAGLEADGTDAWLIVDEAWGSHLPVMSGVSSAATLGADLVSTSTHKQAGGLQGTAVLVTPRSSKVKDEWIAASMRALASTSPPFLLLGSIESVYQRLLDNGSSVFETARGIADDLRRRVDGSCARWSLERFCETYDSDPLKLTLRLPGGTTGFEIAQHLKDERVILEKEGFGTVTFLVTLQMPPEAPAILASALGEVLRQIAPEQDNEPRADLPDPFANATPMKSTHRRARETRSGLIERVELADAAGRVSAERFSAYPPGIPVLFEGVAITQAQVEYLLAVASAGGHFASNSGYEIDGERPMISVVSF